MSWVAFGLERTTYAWDIAYRRPCIEVSSEGLQMSAVPRADCREVVLSSLARACVLFCLLLLLHRPVSYRTEYVGVRVQSLEYIGYSPADDLSVDFRKMGFFVSDSFGGVLPNKVYATLEIRAS